MCIINGRIESNVYSKPTDGHMYLLPQSSHYRSMHLHIPFGVALRKIGLKNNCLNTNNILSVEITKIVLYTKDLIRLKISLCHRR